MYLRESMSGRTQTIGPVEEQPHLEIPFQSLPDGTASAPGATEFRRGARRRFVLARSIVIAPLLACVWVSAPCFGQAAFQGLGDLPGGDFESSALDVSGDGSVVVGYSKYEAGGNVEAFRWTEDGGIVGLGFSPYVCPLPSIMSSQATGVSDDGLIVGGTTLTALIGGCNGDSFLWEDGTLTDLGTVGNATWNSALAISGDGNVIAAFGAHGGDMDYRSLRWEGGWQEALATTWSA